MYLPAFLVNELKDYRVYLTKESLKAGRGASVDLLFPDPEEKGLWPFSQRKVQALVKRVCKASGLGKETPMICGTRMRHCFSWPIRVRAMFCNNWVTARFPSPWIFIVTEYRVRGGMG